MLNFRAGWNVQFLFLGIALAVMLLSEPLMAQSSKKTNVKQLNVQADKLKDSFIRESAEIARKYSEAGDYEKSREMLEVIQSIQKDVPGVKAMITQLNEKLMSSNSSDFDIDVARNWSTPAGLVAKGKMVRIQAMGTYDFVADIKTTVEGLPHSTAMKELADGIPTGALMGIVISQEKGKPKMSKPFLIGEKAEFTPRADGVLMIGLNLPAGHKSTGKLKVRISGYIRRGSK
ncbi:hypothetical protein [Gimesia maris]|uniref:Uncharacterized protein n=1 Tax=Gimesia maris TaxID=122 RepID=A0ABX5YTA8_9PLAN|nr:hypothetical protein [Gimesia maris]EDL58841.1 hypothetical protein PM8797T_19879 [Gimesia maris DSM 8797]QEG18830.1 hypothetical protein GmarT_47230 [Gimesia maris]QGQ28255.1 hypothetical protein F1729_06055 [Gimesia maris]